MEATKKWLIKNFTLAIFDRKNIRDSSSGGMMEKRFYIRKTSRLTTISLIFLTSLSGCASVQLVSDYDQVTDESATAMQRDITAFLVKLQSDPTDTARNFGSNVDFYKEQSVNIEMMATRARAISKNALTIQQINLLRSNLAWMALLHKGCVGGALTDSQKLKVQEAGIDTTLDCNASSGADSDIKDRSAVVMNKLYIPVLKGLFESALGAIIKFEIAKKRGETK